MSEPIICVGKQYRITYPNCYHNLRHEGKVATAVELLPCRDVLLKFNNGKQVTYHASWLEVVDERR